MTHAGRFGVEPEHPALPGHFPGRPILPGVVLLDHVTEAVAAVAHRRVCGLASVKFVRPVRPGDVVDIACAPPVRDRVRFVCRVGPDIVAEGAAMLEPTP